ncbi:MAG: prepilin-type N-terminal cleavage/methylation domain-containing protein, partial [Chloroflexi bacterium]|nr:prepilin-type N-terminal cleavage/methylation domain-containing protein [Chloroflexota bacterium]
MKSGIYRRRERALTLVEALVVVAVIGVMMILIWPGLARSRRPVRSVHMKCV